MRTTVQRKMALLVTSLAFFWLTNIELVLTAPMMTAPKTMDYLQKYGYMKKESTDMSPGIKKFQKMMQMTPTGIMDEKTSDAMHAPRCGLPDMTNGKKIKERGWKREVLKYKINNFANPDRSRVSPKSIREAISNAFQIWADVSNLRFIQGGENETVEIDIEFVKGNHAGANHAAFDGPAPKGVELAHAGKPRQVELEGDIHFDDDEIWVLTKSSQDFRETEFNLLYVAVHEIGHSIGLTHTDQRAIMGPMYQNATVVKLETNDIIKVQDIYGPPRSPKSRIFSDNSFCDDPKIDAAFNTVDGSTFVIKGNYYWKLTGTGLAKSEYPIQVDRMWVNAPNAIDAAFTNIEKSKTFFIRGSQVSRYSRYKPDKTGDLYTWFGVDLDSVDAIFKGGDNQPTYFFKGDIFRKKVGTSISSGLIANEFKGVPNNLDAAVMYKRKYNQPPDPVFFKGDKCYYRKYITSPVPGKAGQFTDEYVQAETKLLFGCP